MNNNVHILYSDSIQKCPLLADESVHLAVTSPPYFNAPFDSPDSFASYEEYTDMLYNVFEECYRVLVPGRICSIVVDDMLVNGKKYPIVADVTRLCEGMGFTYRDRIIWRKPEGYIRISRRSGVFIQHPYPMYFYPDNLNESILIFQKGKFEYSAVDPALKEASKLDTGEWQDGKWYLSEWDIANVTPRKDKPDVAEFPNEIPYRLIKLFSYRGDLVLDPFAGTFTTGIAASQLDRSSIGYEISEGARAAAMEKWRRNGMGFLDMKLGGSGVSIKVAGSDPLLVLPILEGFNELVLG